MGVVAYVLGLWVPAVSLAGPAAAGSTAAESAAIVDAITLPDAVLLAQREAPIVVLAAARAEVVHSEVDVARAFRDPQILVGTTSATAVFIGGVSWWVPLFRQRGKAIATARAQGHAADAGTALVRADAGLAVTLAWLDLWLADRLLALAREDDVRRDRLREAAKVRFDEGAAPRTHSELRALQTQREASSIQLSLLLGRDPTTRLRAVGDPPATPTAVPGDALDAHPRTAQARAGLRASNAFVHSEQRSRWPLLGISLQGWFAEDRASSRGRAGVANDYRVLVTADLPLFDAGRVKRAHRQRDLARVQLAITRAEVQAEVMRARAAYDAAAERCAAQITIVVPAVREAAELSSEAYAAGGLDLTGALAIEQSLSDAQLVAALALVARGRAVAALNYAIGAT